MTPNGLQRLISLDVFRGFTIVAMIFVNNLTFWSDTPRFPRLVHAEWHGCTFADLIFPCFLFIIGLTSVFSLEKRLTRGESYLRLYQHIFGRSAVLFLLGLLACSWFIFGWLFQAICPPAETEKSIWAIILSPPDNPDVFFFSLANLRIPGVLQRIALVYLAIAILQIHTRWRVQAITAVALLLIYWGLMSLPGFSLQPGKDLGAFIDRAVFGEAHLWRFTHTWDPEGLLSTLPAIATGLAGVLTGHWLRSDREGIAKLKGLLLFGFLGLGLGALWGQVFPINKNLWTSSYAVYTAGFALIFLGFWYWLIDLRGVKLIFLQPFHWLGLNPLFAYVGSQIGVIALGTLYIGTVSEHTHLNTLILNTLFGENWNIIGQSHWRNPSLPSLTWALIYLSIWTSLAGLLYRRRLFIKI